MDQLGSLAGLFARGGLVSRLKRKLNRLKGKKCEVVPAKGTIACVDHDDTVYLGVEFLAAYHDQEDVIAGVLAHEWGHTCAEDRPGGDDIQHLNWNEIFELRRAHEVLADEISGRLLALMGYKSDGLVNFLLGSDRGTHNLKYHSPKVRAEIIRRGHHDETRKMRLARDIFGKSQYYNDHTSRLIEEDL